LSLFQRTSQRIAHSGSICKFSSFLGKTILSLSNGKVFKYSGTKLFLDGIYVGKIAFGAFSSLVLMCIKSLASPACSRCHVKFPATPKVAISSKL
jgi:hypothetical protein